MHKIEVNNIQLYAYHGCLPEETKIGGNYIVDVELITNFSEAAEEDDLSKTIDYVLVNKIVEEEMAIPSKLIEHVGLRIIKSIKQKVERLERVSVKVRKLSPPINGNVNEVSITIVE